MTDAELEQKISAAREALASATDQLEKHAAWARLQELLNTPPSGYVLNPAPERHF